MKIGSVKPSICVMYWLQNRGKHLYHIHLLTEGLVELPYIHKRLMKTDLVKMLINDSYLCLTMS